MMTPWATPAAGADAPRAGRNDRSDRPSPSTAAGYADRALRRTTERSARAAVAEALRAARDALTARQRLGADGGALAVVARLEAAQGQVQWLIDRLGLPVSPGAWFDGAQLPAGAADWLAATDARLLALVDELAATVAGADDGAVADAADATVAELRGQFDTRRDALAAAAWSARSLPAGLAALMPFGTVMSDGAPRRALEVMRYARGDVAALLDDGMIVWEDAASLPAGARIAFEAADGVTVPLPPPPALTLADDGFRLSFHDDGAGELHGAFGRRRVAAERWLLRGDAGGWLWLARGGEGTGAGGGAAAVGVAPAVAGADSAAAWRGVGVDGRT